MKNLDKMLIIFKGKHISSIYIDFIKLKIQRIIYKSQKVMKIH